MSTLFYLEHRACGDLEREVTDGDPGWVVIACSCGGWLVRQAPTDSSYDA
jgi:hypothetical protein